MPTVQMEYRKLGRSGVKVSALCLGCMNFGDATGETDAIAIIHRAIDEGINFIDTSNSYTRGASETIVGKALAEGNRRDKVVLATKVTTGMGPGVNDRGSHRYHIARQVEASLRRLQTDHIDLYQLHYMDFATSMDETLRTMDDLVRAGKVLYIGCSKFAPAYMVEAIMTCRQYGWTYFVSEQPPYNLLDRRIENELVYTCQKFGVGIVAYGPIAAGILSGKYVRQGDQPPGSRYHQLDHRLNLAAMDAVDALRPLAAEKGVTLAEFALAWVLRQPGVTAPITGARTMDHLLSSLNALEVRFTEEDYRRINAICPPGSAVSDYYDMLVFRPYREAAGITKPVPRAPRPVAR
jgi:aryl-alcohol dehydrogenase-like predicted oxidoreductase